MELIRGIHNIRACHHGCVLTIGNFDGVHRGHQALLKQLREEGDRLGLPVIVMTFEPQPLEFFAPESAPTRLTGLRDKYKYLAQAGVDYLLCVKFDHNFAAMRADDFISELLVKKLGVKFLVVGDDFSFGAQRQGNLALLKKMAVENNFIVVSAGAISDLGQRISSTTIRRALAIGDLSTAENLLGRPYSISGRVIHGRELGRTIGFPTANIKLKGLISPIKGVYAVDVKGLEGRTLQGIANIGTRPTVSGVTPLLETHILDREGLDLYGSHIEVILRMKIRDEQRFSSLVQLKQQIIDDVVTARQFFSTCPTIT